MAAINAHFEDFVSGWQVGLTLPEGVSITGYEESGEMVIFHLDPEGRLIRYNPLMQASHGMTRFIGLSCEMDYDENG